MSMNYRGRENVVRDRECLSDYEFTAELLAVDSRYCDVETCCEVVGHHCFACCLSDFDAVD